MPKAFTTDYEHFADEKLGLLPYLASSVKELIQSEETEKLHKLQDDIVFVADSLYDLLDEVDTAVTKYEQMKNKMLAIEAAMEEKKNALQAVKAEMLQAFGEKEDDTPELVLESSDGTKVVRVTDEPADVMSEEMKTLMDEMLTIENVVGDSPQQEDLRDIGLVFNDEIDEIAAAEEKQGFSLEADDDEGLYTDFDLPEEDTDDGYKPLESLDEEFSLDIPGEPEEETPEPDSAEQDFMGILDDDDFFNMFDDDDNPITEDELVMDDDEFAVIDVDDYGEETSVDYDEHDGDDSTNGDDEPKTLPTVTPDASTNLPTGFVPPDFF